MESNCGAPRRWYEGNAHEGPSFTGIRPMLISIGGGSASGKTTVCERIVRQLGGQRVELLSMDEFYKNLSAEELANLVDHNFDEPAAFDIDCLVAQLDGLLRGEDAEVPVYDFTLHQRKAETRLIKKADVIVIEGILALHIPELVARSTMKVFVDTDDDVRLARRIRRDIQERGRDVEGVISQYTRFVVPSFQSYVLPSKRNADVIVPWREDNFVAVDLISQSILTKISLTDLRRVYQNLYILPSNLQTRGMHTLIRARDTSRTDFVFYADRLIRLVVEAALGELPFKKREVVTPNDCVYSGVEFVQRLCGLSLIRSGEAMENALRDCCAGIKIGKILIDKSPVYEKLPHDVADRHILLMAPILATGTRVEKAVEALTKKYEVDESRIIVLTLIAAPQGIHQVCCKHPRMKVVTSEIDEGLDANGFVSPGLGHFADRYFGTSPLASAGCDSSSLSCLGDAAPTL